ncbi:hypothetical protein ACFV28_13070 [Streptomyces sp. NPDC059720]|uniref:hypothetical protein n=1 Tax=Streptomyces sp. NPDC059720 TaxID=3346924 RepID=UPI0036957375
MSDTDNTLKGQYAAQVAADISRNEEELALLRARLEALETDLSVLRNVQEALELTVEKSTALTGGPSGSGKTGNTAKVSESARSRPQGVVPRSRGAHRSPRDGGRGKRQSPTLRELVENCLVEQGAPTAAAEVAAVIAERHPERNASIPVVRGALENLVARNRAERTKQGSSVFYSIPSARQETAGAEPARTA